MSGLINAKSAHFTPMRWASAFCNGRIVLLPAAEAPLVFMITGCACTGYPAHSGAGSRPGREVPQLYVGVPAGKLDQPHQTLAGVQLFSPSGTVQQHGGNHGFPENRRRGVYVGLVMDDKVQRVL